MDIFLDDEPVALAGADELTVGQLAEQIRTRLSDDRRLLTCVRCDGQALDAAGLESAMSQAAGDYGCIEFQSSDLGELVRSALTAATELFDQSDRTRHQAADFLNEGQLGKAMTALGQCFGAWSQAHETVVQSSRLLKLDLANVTTGDVEVGAWLGLLRDKLRELKDALEVSDHVLVADILRYEFDEIFAQWKQIVAYLTDQAQTV